MEAIVFGNAEDVVEQHGIAAAVAAKELIRTSAMNFTEIAEAVGFESLHYFSRVFKARTGLSPSQYAKGQ